MSTPAPTAMPAAPERRAGGSAARSGAPPGETPFASLLENDRARTASAEGPKREKPGPTRPADRRSADDRPGQARAEREPAPDAASAAHERPVDDGSREAASEPALCSPAPAATALTALAPVPAPAAPVVLPTGLVTVPATAAGAAPATTAAASISSVPAVPAPSADAGETVGVPAPAGASAETTPAAGEATEAALRHAGRSAEPSGGEPGGRRDATQPTPRPRASEQGVAHAAPGSAVHRAAASAPVTETAGPEAPRAPEVTTAATPQPAPAAPPSATARGAVPLEQTHRTVEAALQLAAHRGGVTRARLQLHPAELGAIEIHLRHTAGGVTARLIAESPEALAVLQQNGADLRRSLEDAGIDVLGLDIGARSDDERRAGDGAFAGALADGSPGRGDAGSDEDEGQPAASLTTPTLRARLPLPGGALLDVLA